MELERLNKDGSKVPEKLRREKKRPMEDTGNFWVPEDVY